MNLPVPCIKESLILAVVLKCVGQSLGLILFCNYYIIHMYSIMELRPLKNIVWENANKLEKRKRAWVTSCRPVNLTANLVIPRVCRVRKYCFLLRQTKHSAIHQRRDKIISIILIGLYCLKIGQM